jgi:hypothetical protein
MAQVFVSHSKLDSDLVNFFNNAFFNTGVMPVFEEFEAILGGTVTPSKVIGDIKSSNAVFVVLSRNVHGIPHTRDWVVWETGVANNRDIWVFEPYSQLGSISIVIPYLRHYVIYDTVSEHLAYIKKIIESYDDSHLLPTMIKWGSAGAGLGAALHERDRAKGATVGGLGAAFLGGLVAKKAKSEERPTGIDVMCIDCNSSFSLHIPEGMNSFRCPVCNVFLGF